MNFPPSPLELLPPTRCSNGSMSLVTTSLKLPWLSPRLTCLRYIYHTFLFFCVENQCKISSFFVWRINAIFRFCCWVTTSSPASNPETSGTTPSSKQLISVTISSNLSPPTCSQVVLKTSTSNTTKFPGMIYKLFLATFCVENQCESFLYIIFFKFCLRLFVALTRVPSTAHHS